MWGRGKRYLAVILAASGLALAGCANSSGGGIDPVGTWVESNDQNAPSLTLDKGGALSGSDGCNSLSGSWRIENNNLVDFEGVASTSMACPDVDTWLDGLSQATISGTTMTILGGDGAQIGQLQRSDESG